MSEKIKKTEFVIIPREQFDEWTASVYSQAQLMKEKGLPEEEFYKKIYLEMMDELNYLHNSKTLAAARDLREPLSGAIDNIVAAYADKKLNWKDMAHGLGLFANIGKIFNILPKAIRKVSSLDAKTIEYLIVTLFRFATDNYKKIVGKS